MSVETRTVESMSTEEKMLYNLYREQLARWQKKRKRAQKKITRLFVKLRAICPHVEDFIDGSGPIDVRRCCFCKAELQRRNGSQ